MYKLLLVLLICVNLFSLSFSLSTTKYLATVHHSNSDFREKRNVQESQFVGDIIFNNTVNEKGEITLSLCDITKDVFSGSIPSLPLFNYDRSTRVAGIASAKLQASFNSRINIDGCLVFFFNPCCKTFGLKFVLDDPVILNAFGKLKVDIEAFNLGISLGSEDITVDPLRNIELKGFSPEIGSWNLPPILDKTIQLDDESLCAKLGVPGSNVGLDFCVVLGNFSAGINGVNVCPRLTISLGSRVLLDLSYTALSSDLPECLTLSFLPTCSYKGSSVSPDIVQLFKSSDANNDQKIMVSELQKSKLLLGIFESEEANSASFSEMDTNSDGEVNFAEFEKYTATQQEINASGDYVTKKEGKKFSGGDIAMAVIFSILGTALIVCAVLAGVAQYKGIINNKYLGKVIPTK